MLDHEAFLTCPAAAVPSLPLYASTSDTIALAGHVIDTHILDRQVMIVFLQGAVVYVTIVSYRTLIGRQDARTLLYSISEQRRGAPRSTIYLHYSYRWPREKQPVRSHFAHAVNAVPSSSSRRFHSRWLLRSEAFRRFTTSPAGARCQPAGGREENPTFFEK